MILPDLNLLIYSVNADSPFHRGAKTWMEETLNGKETVGLSWGVLVAFIRITTRRNIFAKPVLVEEAFEYIEAWLAHPSVTLVHPGPRHFSILRELLMAVGTGGNLTSDAHLAALAIEHGAELCSSDYDFGRFPRLNWSNPLEGNTLKF
jgi:toxin-antitoxin system PIN domain toxin